MMKKYDEYKACFLPGIESIPSHWKSVKLKFIGQLYSGLSGKSGDDFYDAENPLSKPYINFKNIANNIKINPTQFDVVVIKPDDEQNKVKKGDLFFLMSSENFGDIGKTAVLEHDLEETYLNSFCRGFRIFDKHFDPGFLNYLLLSNLYRQQLSIEAKGFTRINIQVGKIQNFSICVPYDREEQTAIARYLDHQTSIIDQLIQQKEKLIELLKEKRQAVINEAVTKGLNPKAKLKDSGIEWLGKVPVDWEIVPLKHLASLKGRLGWKGLKAEEYVDNGFGFLSTPDIKNESIDFKSINYITEARYLESPEIMLEVDDVLLVKDGSTLGIVNYIKELPFPSTVNSSIGIIRVIDKNILNPEYLLWQLKSDYMQIVINRLKAGQGVPHLFQKDIKNFAILVPSIKTQNKIVELIISKNKVFNQIIRLESLQIEKLKEYRQSIISEAVTGKIDLRDWQPNELKQNSTINNNLVVQETKLKGAKINRNAKQKL